MSVQKTLAPRAWKSRSDSHFYTDTATAANLQFRLHLKCLDDQGQGYIFKWLDRDRRRVADGRIAILRETHHVLGRTDEFQAGQSIETMLNMLRNSS